MLVIGAVVASLLLVCVYLAAGGADYEPTPVADPCASRDVQPPHGLEEEAQQFFLSAVDGAACELGVSREELVVALATEESRQEFAAEHGIDDATLDAAVRAGAVRAIDDAVDDGELSPLLASGLRELAQRLPVEQLIDLIGGAQSVFDDAGNLLDQLGGLIP